MRQIEKPNLPENKVTKIAIGIGYRGKLEARLEKLAVEVLWLAENHDVDMRLSSHADLSLIHIKDEKYISVNNLTIGQGSKYPNDAVLNACIVGDYFIHNLAVTDKILLDAVKDAGYLLINVRQAYTKCSICVVDNNSIITADAGIYKALENTKLNVLLISQGHIKLDGFDYGFIGGSTFKLSKYELAFTGLLDKHPDKDRILHFLSERGISPVFLTDEEIFDIGSAVLINEKL